MDVEALRQRILAQEESAWYEQKLRQNEYDVHRYTESIVLVFTDGSGWPNIEVSKQPGWGRLVEEAMPLMHGIIGSFYPAGGTIIRAMAAKLLAGGKIKPHRDAHPSFH